jgi:hypothetical protein
MAVHGEGPTSSAGRPGRSHSGLQTRVHSALALPSRAQVAVELTAWLVQLYISVQFVMASCVFFLAAANAIPTIMAQPVTTILAGLRVGSILCRARLH